MKKLLKLMALCILVAMQSCSSDNEPQYVPVNQSNTEISKMVVRFNGKIYETDVQEVGDSVTYLNEEYAEVYRSKIANSDEVSAVLYSDENGVSYVDYFSSEKELLKEYQFLHIENDVEPEVLTRSNSILNLTPQDGYPLIATASLYRDSNFSNDVLIVGASTKWATCIPNFKTISFNDRVSSIKVINHMSPSESYTMYYYDSIGGNNELHHRTHSGSGLRPVLKCCKDAKFKGTTIYCISSPTGSTVDHTDKNLKKIKFNDAISSIGWLVIYDFSMFNSNGDNGPAIPAHGDCNG